MTPKPQKERKFQVDRVWFIDKGIELSIFVLGLLIALYIDDVRDSNQVKQLKEHHLEIVQIDLEKDLENYERALEHDSLRAEGCDYVLDLLVDRQKVENFEAAVVTQDAVSKKGPEPDFENANSYIKSDTVRIVTRQNDWCLTTNQDWIEKSDLKIVPDEFSWFSPEMLGAVKDKIEFYQYYLDETKSVFQHKTGYLGLISQNTSAFLSTTEVETKLSDYYSFGSYLNWLEDYYRDNHYPHFNELRYSFGKQDFYQFLYLLNNEQNNALIQQMSLAGIHAKKEIAYYREAIVMNKALQLLLKDKQD